MGIDVQCLNLPVVVKHCFKTLPVEELASTVCLGSNGSSDHHNNTTWWVHFYHHHWQSSLTLNPRRSRWSLHQTYSPQHLNKHVHIRKIITTVPFSKTETLCLPIELYCIRKDKFVCGYNVNEYQIHILRVPLAPTLRVLNGAVSYLSDFLWPIPLSDFHSQIKSDGKQIATLQYSAMSSLADFARVTTEQLSWHV